MSRAPAMLLAAKSQTAASISYITNAASSSGLTNYTFSTQSIGTAATGRRIIVIASGYSTTGGRTFSSVTIGGNAATSIVTASDSGGVVNSQLAGIFILQVDAGTTADIVVNFSGGMGGCDIGVFAAYDLFEFYCHGHRVICRKPNDRYD